MQNKIASWLEKHDLGAYTALFESMHIGTDILHSLTEDDLKELDIPLGDRKRFLRALSEVSASAVGRRQLTVLICDLVGSTELSQNLSIEAYRQCLGKFRAICKKHIDFFDGYIYQYRGDAVIAYFSYPKGQERSAARAAYAALGILEGLSEHNALRGEDPSLEARIGIATGMVIAGAELDQGTMHENAVGIAPNLAARLQALANPGEVVIAELTQRLVQDLFRTQALPQQRVKGLDDVVQPYLLHNAVERHGADLIPLNRPALPFFGRTQELHSLQKLWSNENETLGFVQIVGDAGMGKSRLIREFRQSLNQDLSPVLTYYCSPYHRHSALFPVAQTLRRALQIQANASGDLDTAQMQIGLQELGVSATAQIEALTALLNAKATGAQDTNTKPHTKVDLFAAIIAMLGHTRRKEKTLLIIEDVHWIDPSTQELLRKVLEKRDALNCFVLISTRPEFNWPVDDSIPVTNIELTPLSQEISTQFVCEILGEISEREKLVEEIVGKAAGIPLFIEETARAVTENSALGDTNTANSLVSRMGVPPTLNDSLMAKLDRLGDVKFTALVAAVIGQEFSQDILETLLSETRASVAEDLNYLLRSGALKIRRTPFGWRYTFIHGLLQDVAYDTLLHDTREKIHSDVADALIPYLKVSNEFGPEMVAHHLTQSQRVEEAVHYWIRAGRMASERSALQEAVVHFRNALTLMETLPSSPENIRIKLRILQGMAAPLLGTTSYRSVEVKEVANLAISLCEEAKFENEIPVFLYTIWIGEQADGNHQYALSLAQNFLSMARRHQDRTAQMVAHRALAWSELNLGNLATAHTHLVASRTLYDKDQHDALVYSYGTDHLIGIGCGEAQTLWALGFADSALAIANNTIQSAEKSDLAVSRFLAYQYSGCLLNTLCRRWQDVRRYSALLLKLGAENNLQQASLVGAFYRDMGEVIANTSQDSYHSAMKIIALARQLGYLYMMPLWYTMLADACLSAGFLDCAQTSLDEALKIIDTTQENWYLADIHRIGAEIAFLRNNEFDTHCEEKLQAAIDLACAQEGKAWELRARTLQRTISPQLNKQEVQAFERCCVWFSEGKALEDWQRASHFLNNAQ